MYSTIPLNAMPSVPISSVLVTEMFCSMRPREISVAASERDLTAPITLRSVAIAIRASATSESRSTTPVTVSIVVCKLFALANAAVIMA